MKQLLKPAEYAKKIGLSRQAVYAKIKKGLIRSKEVEGKLYVEVEESSLAEKENRTDSTAAQELLDAKEETIEALQNSIKEIKASSSKVEEALKSEIELLKAAFYEMKQLYGVETSPKQIPTFNYTKAKAQLKEIAKKKRRKKIKAKLLELVNNDNRLKVENGKLYIQEGVKIMEILESYDK